jgi:phage shock protein C
MKKLQRSKTNKVFFGVCGGIAEHLGLDPVVVRLVFILVTLFGGMGVLAYIIGVIIIPEASHDSAQTDIAADTQAMAIHTPPAPLPKRDKSSEVVGLTLIAFGLFFLLRKIDALDRYFDWISYHFWSILLPVLLLVLGVSLIMRTRKGE